MSDWPGTRGREEGKVVMSRWVQSMIDSRWYLDKEVEVEVRQIDLS